MTPQGLAEEWRRHLAEVGKANPWIPSADQKGALVPNSDWRPATGFDHIKLTDDEGALWDFLRENGPEILSLLESLTEVREGYMAPTPSEFWKCYVTPWVRVCICTEKTYPDKKCEIHKDEG